jgi:hypothetical protein
MKLILMQINSRRKGVKIRRQSIQWHELTTQTIIRLSNIKGGVASTLINYL